MITANNLGTDRITRLLEARYVHDGLRHPCNIGQGSIRTIRDHALYIYACIRTMVDGKTLISEARTLSGEQSSVLFSAMRDVIKDCRIAYLEGHTGDWPDNNHQRLFED